MKTLHTLFKLLVEAFVFCLIGENSRQRQNDSEDKPTIQFISDFSRHTIGAEQWSDEKPYWLTNYIQP